MVLNSSGVSLYSKASSKLSRGLPLFNLSVIASMVPNDNTLPVSGRLSR
ncbi:hypothetical protein ES703_91864 [subsurface metagenome]